MQWHDLSTDDGPAGGGILELEPVAPGLALELHVYPREGGTLALWVLEDGRVIGEVAVGRG